MEPLTRPRVLRASAALLCTGLLSLLAPETGRRAWLLFERIDPAAPYGAWVEPFELYVRLPLAVLGSAALVLAPGMLLAMACARPRTAEAWLLQGFALSVALLGPLVPLAQALVGELAGPRFTAFCSALALACGIAAWLAVPPPEAVASGRSTKPWPVLAPGVWLGLLGVPFLFLAALLPKFLWESFNGDGAHAFEASRLLLRSPLPFWEPGAGEVAAYPGLNSVLYLLPNSWFLRLFGELEAAARLPYLPYMALLYAALADAAQQARPEPLGRAARALLWAGVVSFSLVLAFSATYDPYCADLALPATQDALLVVLFLAMAAAFLRGERGWALVHCAGMLLCSPAGLLLAGAWLLAVAACSRERPWRRLAAQAAGIAALAVTLALVPALLARLGLPAPGGEHQADALLSKFRYVLPNDFRRLLWLLLPCGVYPLLALASWRRADDGSRALLATGLFVFATYYFMAFVSLHYFAPAMLLPLAAFWRIHRPSDWRARRALLAGSGALALLSIALALPTTAAIYTGSREVGASLDASRLEGYARMRAPYFKSIELLRELFVPGWTPSVPAEHYCGSPLSWNYYAQRAREPGDPATYLLLPEGGEPPPERAELVASDGWSALYALDPERWRAQRAWRPPGSSGPAVYGVPRDILFKRKRAFERYDILDVESLLSGKPPR
jgi:hypothetical protein